MTEGTSDVTRIDQILGVSTFLHYVMSDLHVSGQTFAMHNANPLLQERDLWSKDGAAIPRVWAIPSKKTTFLLNPVGS